MNRALALQIAVVLAIGGFAIAVLSQLQPADSSLGADSVAPSTAAADPTGPDPTAGAQAAANSTTTTPATPTPVDEPLDLDRYVVDPGSSTKPWSALGAADGLLTFRGNPTRTYHGRGPVPTNPIVRWSHYIGCSNSSVGGTDKQWCGSGWTGQPAVFELDGRWTVAFGAYDRQVNFLDASTGDAVLAPYETGDIIKGTVTIDPDGYPLVYTGSRDGFYHVVAIDRDPPEALWKLSADAVQPTRWNNDWDGAGLVIDDYLFEGGENSRFFIVKLNRDFDDTGRVTVSPYVYFSTESWDDQLARESASPQYSIENSVAIVGDVVYWANSAGLIQGWTLSGLKNDQAPWQVFRYYAGDDIDASLVADSDGNLYVGVEYEQGTERSQELGQILKLDPSNPDDPLVWGVDARSGPDSGVWATPALWDDLVIVATDDGRVLGLDAATGAEQWTLNLPGPLWSSPVVVDDVLIQPDCGGNLNAFDLTPGAAPTPKWSVALGGCIESTPAVWDGWIYVGSRDGSFYAIADSTTSP